MDQQPLTQTTPPPTPIAPAPPATGRKSWLIGGIIAGVLVLLGGLGWWLAISAQDAYVKAVEPYETNLKEAFLFYKNSTDTEAQQDEIRRKFDDALASRPTSPKLLGVPLPTPQTAAERIDKITEPFLSLRESFVDYHAFNAFAEASLDLLNELEQTPPLVDPKTSQGIFEQGAQDLRDLKNPDGANPFKNEKADILEAIAEQIGKAKTALAAADLAGYKAADAEIKKLLPKVSVDLAVDELQKIYRNYYDDLSDKYDAAAQALGIEG